MISPDRSPIQATTSNHLLSSSGQISKFDSRTTSSAAAITHFLHLSLLKNETPFRPLFVPFVSVDSDRPDWQVAAAFFVCGRSLRFKSLSTSYSDHKMCRAFAFAMTMTIRFQKRRSCRTTTARSDAAAAAYQHHHHQS